MDVQERPLSEVRADPYMWEAVDLMLRFRRAGLICEARILEVLKRQPSRLFCLEFEDASAEFDVPAWLLRRVFAMLSKEGLCTMHNDGSLSVFAFDAEKLRAFCTLKRREVTLDLEAFAQSRYVDDLYEEET